MKAVLALLALCGLCASVAHATAESDASKMARALAAGPTSVSTGASALFMADDGKITTLRKGSNGWICVVGTKGKVGADPFCADPAGMRWVMDWVTHKKAPTNTKPGLIYMLAGGSDWSATDPWATKGASIKEPPHWMIMYPYGKSSGLPTGMKMSGTWIMWAGTPYAHLMINQKP